MNYSLFLETVILEGIDAAKRDYSLPKDKNRLEGSIAGFQACLNKSPEELLMVWQEAQEYVNKESVAHNDPEKYWWFRCYQLEVEWVCNVISAILYNEGKEGILPWQPTGNAMRKAASIIGVKY